MSVIDQFKPKRGHPQQRREPPMRDEPETVSAPRPTVLQPLAAKAAEFEQYVANIEAERDRLKRELGEANNEIHLLNSTLRAVEMDNASLKERCERYAEQLIEVKTEAKVSANVILGVLKKLDDPALAQSGPEFASRKPVDVDMDRLSEQMLKAHDRDPPPSFLTEPKQQD